MNEVELKYALNKSDELRLRDSLTQTASFGSFEATLIDQGDHRDTYLDRNGQLQRHGWSLRIREHSTGSRITLKIPRSEQRSGAAIERQEIENTSAADVNTVFAEIVTRMNDANILADEVEVADVLAHGLFGALESLGLVPLFTVRTSRTTWRLADRDRQVADLVLDTSRYQAGATEELVEHQMEIELTDLAAENVLNTIVATEFGLLPTTTTKFIRGLEFHGATQLKEKVEAKLDLPEAADHATVVKMLRDEPKVIRGYRILGQGLERRITDQYYDTPGLDLAHAHCYLRIREENGERKLHFRRLAPATDSRVPVQEEIKGTDADSDFATSWQVIATALTKLLRRSQVDGRSGMTAGIRQLNLVPTLRADIVRLAWVAKSADDDIDSSRSIAKLKVDDVTFEDAAGQRRHHSEIEITGLEDEAAAPEYVDDDGFRIFMHRFRQICSQRIFRGRTTPDLHIGTKYHAGLYLFGRIDGSLATFPGDALVRQAPMWSDLEPEARSSLLRTAVFVALSALGLSALSGAASDRWRWVLLGVGIVLIVAACLVLIRDDSALVSRRTQQWLMTGVAMLGAGIVAVGVGSSTAADLVGLIGFPLTVLGLLALNSRERPRP